MASLTHEALQLIVKKLDQILKILKLGRRSNDREEEEKTLNENDIFSRPNNPEHEFMRKDKKEPVSEEKFITAMHNVMKWVNKKKE
jgi:hypothetical protein